MSKISIPREYRERLSAAARRHGFASAKALGELFVERGLKKLGTTAEQLGAIVESQGYSSEAELIEHLLERGLGAYESGETDPEKLKARLRGLGYLD